ncbi:TPR-like protein [Dioscorea alata]|uniref:TPR-like protein n=1 Tax=Dioscorea alata TaxID=55571 RepID=A0ACB7W6A1_DIOAL|nr:TPR-like protein [Dioscorea alata]
MRLFHPTSLLPLKTPSLINPIKQASSSSSTSRHPQTSIISSLLKSCSHSNHLKQTHAKILTLALHHHHFSFLSSLTLSYISHGLIHSAHLLFHTIPSPSPYLYNLMIRSLANHGHLHQSLGLYSSLLSSTTHHPDKFTFPFALKSCAALSDIHNGKQIHQHSICLGCENDPFVRAALVDMYSKCGYIDSARQVFDKMPQRDLVSWTCMISGYAHNGCNFEVLEFFHLMRSSGVRPNRVSLLSTLLACGRLGALCKGQCIHGHAIHTGFDTNVLVATSIIDMYAKCGSLNVARLMFDITDGKDLVCWSAMIACYGYHGLGRDAIDIFNCMVRAGTKPNHATFTSLLSACSHSGLVNEGRKCFDSMVSVHDVEPKLNHYACMVDLLGRAGRLHEALELIERMPMKPDSSLWGSLLGACRIHGDIDTGEKVADKIFELETTHSGYYVLLSNIYAAKSRWKEVERVRKLMVGNKVSKVQGFSLIEFGNQVHKFGVDDRSHPQAKEIYSYLKELAGKLKQHGYVPLIDFALHDIEDETKEASLLYHSEKLAIAFGLINLSPEAPIRVTKNLRICADCHNAIKITSKVVSRKIVVRDMNRFHHFENGYCSCGDYW